MANQVTDTRTPVNSAEAIGSAWVDISGGNTLSLDNEIFIQGNNSVGEYCTDTRAGIMWNNGSTGDFSNNHWYIWFNCGVVGLLDTKASGGVTVRFAGATITDFFEVYVAGSNDFPTAVSGGWTQFVVDIEEAAANPSNTGGTPPATNQVQYVGVTFITSGTMPRMVDNTWVDEIKRLPDGNPGIAVEGRTGGAADWTWDDIVRLSEASAWGTCKRGPGGSVTLNTPVQFGTADSTTHGFSDTNQIILWENQEFAASDLYGFTIIGATAGGTGSFVAGNQEGTGDASTGNQGWVITAENTGVRWFFDADDVNVDEVSMFGCSFIHADDFQIDDAQVEMRSCLFNDVTSGTISNGVFARNTVVNANTTDGNALLTTSTLDNIKNNAFTFSDGHAIEITSAAGSPYTFTGNTFSGYGGTAGSNLVPNSGSTDAAIYNTSGAAITINIEGAGADSPSVRNGPTATTAVVLSVPLTIDVEDESGTAVANAQVYLQKSSPTEFTSGAGNATGDADLVVTQTIDSDLPQTGRVSVLDRSINLVLPYRYASWSSSTFTFPTSVTGTANVGGSSTTLEQKTGTSFSSADVEEGDTIRNTTDGSFAVVDEIVDADTLTTTGLTGGSDNTWQEDDVYSFHTLATSLASAIDEIDAPIINTQTDAGGNVTKSFPYASDRNIIVRIRSNEGSTKYKPFNTTGIIENDGFSLTAVLIEDTVAT